MDDFLSILSYYQLVAWREAIQREIDDRNAVFDMEQTEAEAAR